MQVKYFHFMNTKNSCQYQILCRSVPSAQYCNNYYSINLDSPDWKPIENLTRKHLQNFGRFRDFQHQDFSKMFDLSKISLKLLEKTANYGFDENEDFDASGLVDLTDILVQKNSYTRKLHDKIQAIIMIPEIQESKTKYIKIVCLITYSL